MSHGATADDEKKKEGHVDWNRVSSNTTPRPSVHTSQDISSTIPPQFSPVPPTVKRHSLVDWPVSPQLMSAPAVVIESPSIDDANGGGPSPPRTLPIETDAPGVASSLTVLKNNGVLSVVPPSNSRRTRRTHYFQLAESSLDGRLVELNAW